MHDLGRFGSLGEAWLAMIGKIHENGMDRDYTDNVGETFRVRECFDMVVSVDHPRLPDPIIDSYKDPQEYEWMLANFNDLARVEALHNPNSYAERLYQYCGVKNQIDWVIRRLEENPLQRSCTITTLEPLTDEKYIPCVSLLDFQRRPDAENILDLNVYCRALDFGSKAYVNMVMLTAILKNICEKVALEAGKLVIIVKTAHYRLVDQSRIVGMLDGFGKRN